MSGTFSSNASTISRMKKWRLARRQCPNPCEAVLLSRRRRRSEPTKSVEKFVGRVSDRGAHLAIGAAHDVWLSDRSRDIGGEPLLWKSVGVISVTYRCSKTG
eukprot:scaffold14694_cov87-Phaeocystis_antarctica.AAC.1